MALPKALLQIFGEGGPKISAEEKLRSAGFATGIFSGKDHGADPRSWMQLASILNDESILAWVLAGNEEDFTSENLCKISLLSLALARKTPLITALVSPYGINPWENREENFEKPEFLDNFFHLKESDSFGAKLMAARFRPKARSQSPFFIRVYPDPQIGLWFEIAPSREKEELWPDFMIGVFGAEISSFGIGPPGVLPKECTLSYPMLGIRGNIRNMEFSACAAKNALSASMSCYCRIEGIPQGIFIGSYPEDEGEGDFCRSMLKFC